MPHAPASSARRSAPRIRARFAGLTAGASAGLVLVWAAFFPCILVSPAAAEEWSQEREIAQWRAAIDEGNLGWEAGPTTLNAIPPEERDAWLGLIPLPEDVLRAAADGVLQPLRAEELPASWDWRALGGTTPAKNQGGCGSCWAFAAVGQLESAYKIANGTELLFSEQQCLSCNDQDQGCDGGHSRTCFDLWTAYGAVTQTCMPYRGSDSWPCTQDECEVPARIRGFIYVNNNLAALKTALLSGPIAVGIYASGGFFSYHSGCYGGPTGPINHMVLLCGWDDNACGSGQGAWLIKNSWGSGWGMSGFGWVRYNTTSIGAQAATIQYAPFPAARIGYVSHQVLDSGNGALDPGEQASLAVSVKNFGQGAATGIQGTLRSLTPGVSVPDSVAAFPNLGSWGAGTSLPAHFTVEVGSFVQPGTRLDFRLEVSSDQSPSDVTTFTDFALGVTTIYSTDFETGTEGWSHGAAEGEDDWRWGTPRNLGGQLDPTQAASGTKVLGNDLNETPGDWDGLYAAGGRQYLLSPVFDCSGRSGVHLQFKRWLTCERSYGDLAGIFVNDVEVWRNINNVHHVDEVWVPVDLNIHTLADDNPSVQVRFELNTTSWKTFGGWNIDDFRVIATGGGPTAMPEAAPFGAMALQCAPNPSSGILAMHLSLPAGGDASVTVYDAQGRLVRTVHQGRLGAGLHRLTWTGCDDVGRPVAAGTYFGRAMVNGQTSTVRLVRTQ